MTKKKKLDLLVKIMMVFNNTLLALSFLVAGLTGMIGLICSTTVYFFIGLILAVAYRKSQHFILTLMFWLPAMSFNKVTGWIVK